MYQLLKVDVDTQTLNRPAKISYNRVFDTVKETGGHHFLHGPAMEMWQGKLCVCFGYNDEAENSITEKLLIRWSENGGKTWGKAESIARTENYANSHSVFLPVEESLWCFGPRFLGLGQPPVTHKGHKGIHFRNLQMEAWRYDGQAWLEMGIVCDDFWPLGAPVKMENGNWLIAGCDEKWLGAVAVSHGDDLLHWDVVKPDTDGEIFTEAAAWVIGNEVLMLMRNQSVMTDGKFHVAVAQSRDGGKTFGPCRISNLPMATTKPNCGVLADGRPFLVFNESLSGAPYDRARMLLGIGEKGQFGIRKLYVVDEGYAAGSREYRLALSYPYARQIGDKLYIAYSYESAPGTGGNHNDAMLAVIDVDCLDE